MATQKLYSFQKFLEDYYKNTSTYITIWEHPGRRSKNLIEIQKSMYSEILYVKDSTNTPGWWGINTNQKCIK